MKPTSTLKYRIAAALLSVLATSSTQIVWADSSNPSVRPAIVGIAQQTAQQPKIQLAILLDTSNSMDGLIDQARNQLWRVVDEFSKARRDGMPVILEVAVFEYGNDTLSAENGHIRKVTGLTTDLDLVSEALFSLTTNGGSEYCGYTIKAATEQLQWSTSDNDIKAIFIAGNEPFTQGPVPYTKAITKAKSVGIVVNTIHAGSYDEGRDSGWQDGALLAGGDYMSIDHNQKIAHIPAPQDQRIAELNAELNKTYVPYGTQGQAGKQRQLEQDANTSSISPALLAKRAKSKAGSLYSNSQWDLVDAVRKDNVELESLDESALPAEMSGMDAGQRKAYVSEKAETRAMIKREIAELSKAREEYVSEEKRRLANDKASTVDDAFVDSIRKQGKQKHYQFLSEQARN
ncbi:MAG: VWA domain-containing protein [Candidatus Thiodiazotropha sp.]